MRTRRHPRVVPLLAVLALMVGLLVACGNDDDVTDETQAPDTTEAPAATDPPETTEPETADVVIYLLVEGDECDETEAVTRSVEGEATLEAALRALLAGPTDEEAAEGLGGWFSDDTDGMLQSATVADGTADVSFDAELRSTIPNASTSCGSAGLLAQLDQTVEEFAEVDRVFYALDGDVDEFYEWLQFSAPER